MSWLIWGVCSKGCFLILHGWQNLVDFIVGFTFIMDYFVHYVVVVTYHFSEVIWLTVSYYGWVLKSIFLNWGLLLK